MRQYAINLWEPSVSPHKLALFRALRDSGRVSHLTYVAQTDLPEARRLQGWSRGLIDDLDVRVAPSLQDIETFIESTSPETVNLFSGVHWSPAITNGLKVVLSKGRRFGLMREPRESEGAKGLARLAHTWATEGPYRRHADFVLAIGRNGPPWFAQAGYSPKRIFPFAYFLAPSNTTIPVRQSLARPLVVFLGRAEREKGLHIVLDARRQIVADVEFQIAGAGSLQDLARQEAGSPGSPLAYLGPLPMPEAQRLLAAADIVCAPSISTNDGWCAVVSEALMAGAAVITTPKVGASVCLEQDQRLGLVVPPTSQAVADAVDKLLKSNSITPELRSWRTNWATGRLTAKAGAEKLLEILDHIYGGAPRPPAFYA